MNSELPLSADALLAERARLEEVLQSSEDWCELLRLKSRKDRGEGMSAVNAARLEMVLIDALAEDPNFIRYKAVCVALERLIRGLPPLPPKGEKPPVEKDDLTEIEGITASMQRRLNALDVTTFMQIAEWTPADIKSISADLGIGRQIFEQDWIGQAEELATRSDEPMPAPTPPSKQAIPQRPSPPPLPRPVEIREPLVQKAPAPPMMREVPRPVVEEKPQVKLEPVAAKPGAPVATSVVAPKIEEPQQRPVVAQPSGSDKVQTADAVQAKAEQKVETKADAPRQTAPQPQAQNAGVAAAEGFAGAEGAPGGSAPLANPPRPLKPEIYGAGPGEPDASIDAKSDAPARLLPIPPSPLRVQAPAASSQSTTDKAASPAAPVELRTPPKPFVITRDSLPKTEPKLEPKIEAKPEVKTDKPAAPPIPPRVPDAAVLKPATAAPIASAAIASGGPSAPSMSIAEAIAYAAEVARQSPKSQPAKAPSANIEPQRNAAPPSGGAVLSPSPKAESPRAVAPATPAPTPAKQPAAKSAPVPAAAPAIPPPLPADFVPPPDENADAEAAYGQVTRVQTSRIADRDDRSDFRSNAEEATVEIVVKAATAVVPTPRAALTKVAAEATANAPRPATPIGRFLKALTGN